MLTLADILEALVNVRPHAEQVITEAAVDSRQAIPGSLFVAIPGEKADGHDFVEAAFKRGASYALVQRDLPDASLRTLDLRGGFPESSLASADFDPPLCLRVESSLSALQQIARFWRRKLNLRVVGITGSVGKSSTKELVAEVLSMRYRTLKNPGNLNNEIGLPLSILRLGSGYERAVLEMGFYVPGEIAFLCDIAQPSIGIVTNIGTVHAERAGSQEAIFLGKAELVQALPPAPDGTAILNFDDPWARKMEEKTRARVFFYGLSPEADLWADEIQGLGLDGIRFRLHYQSETLHAHIPLIGRHSVHTALRAAAAGLVEGLNWQEIFEGLRQEHTQLRLVAVRSESGALLLDDSYNASPESMLAALNLLDELDGRKVAVLGDMLELGLYERQGHEMVGLRAARVADVLLTLGTRARMIAAAARRFGMKRENVHEFDELEPIVEWLGGNLSKDDAVLIKGSHGLRMDRIAAALEARS
ncbi:MAG: UDP-N-acetylmuramoyl-tripeptide--D-alanyl-D-alanine ligase [Anaerolineaceae bacterium]|jgi:UDP-N-acetylmuramoyl-tripeptide--D-alanyl-D-alanine ligase|nr:UDP-N-acetylmuramoyl-tripeptide--D-alanyl-D-alanine ligase [Anaerolineae bacterium]MBL1171226.1 UDP-N-acetylmuramoyl-tripeptide--D-alanyl-D-alanine ligase [Chloroflexota bacterium]MBV6465357.1 UDP-N-acetylmuramoyl-tripeptide--D-alanyl-D-alanine ligase [Anaerolineales bacterium]MCE7905346.1 UDP-N-acetylmuramoyl-tripeptide--D-alanyl-D-alanine ligase [Anaerolineae bacterium CFX3]MDL1925527.1 UDP-N-acetylmuramoyl-tripeptide--D-alanyl-D-alanine ligase [Anaerolineae bacterium AMX1]GER80878.1 UDP-